MTQIEDRFWIETDSFVHCSKPNYSFTTYAIKGTRFPYVHAPHTQNPHNPSLSCLEIFQHAQTFCSKPETRTSLCNTKFRPFCSIHQWFQHAYRTTKPSFSNK